MSAQHTAQERRDINRLILAHSTTRKGACGHLVYVPCACAQCARLRAAIAKTTGSAS